MHHIFTINNKKEEKILRTKTTDFDFKTHNKKKLEKIIKEMRETMTSAIGIGLSANQLGLDMRLFIAQCQEVEPPKVKFKRQFGEVQPPKIEFYAVFNPKIKTPLFRNKKTSMEEGCLSVPGVFGMVERPDKITLIGKDIDGKKIKIKANGLLARVFQHETDHLNGILFTDKTEKVWRTPPHNQT